MNEATEFLKEPNNMLLLWGILSASSLFISWILAASYKSGWLQTTALIPLLLLAIFLVGTATSLGLHIIFLGTKFLELAHSDVSAYMALLAETGIEYSAFPAIIAILALLWFRRPTTDVYRQNRQNLSLTKTWMIVFMCAWIIGFGLQTFVGVTNIKKEFQQSLLVFQLETYEAPIFDGTESTLVRRYKQEKAKTGYVSFAAFNSPANFRDNYLRWRSNFPSKSGLTHEQFVTFILEKVDSQVALHEEKHENKVSNFLLKGIALTILFPIICLFFLAALLQMRKRRVHESCPSH